MVRSPTGIVLLLGGMTIACFDCALSDCPPLATILMGLSAPFLHAANRAKGRSVATAEVIPFSDRGDGSPFH